MGGGGVVLGTDKRNCHKTGLFIPRAPALSHLRTCLSEMYTAFASPHYSKILPGCMLSLAS